jgi:TPR repeat protein
MKRVIIPMIALSFLLGEEGNNTAINLDKMMLEINNKQYDKAIEQLEVIKKKDAQIHFLLGKAYFNKHLAYTDYKFAFQHFQKAKTSEAYYYLGLMYENGLGVPQNIKEALRYYKISTTKEAKYRLAMIYLEGKYVLKDPQKGLELLKRAAKMGDPRAQYELGKLYLTDNDIVTKNLEEAAKWIYLSASNGNFKPAQELWNRYKLYNYQNSQ